MAQCGSDGGARTVDQAAHQADDEVTQASQHLGAMALADLAAVFIEVDIAYPVHALDGPVTAVDGQQLLGACLLRREIGQAVSVVCVLFAGFEIVGVALDLAELAEVGEVEVVVERGGGADTAVIDASVVFIDGVGLRGEWRSSRRPGCRRRCGVGYPWR